MKFISKYKEHKVGLIPSRHIIDNFGRRTYLAGKEAQFHDFQFETEDQEIIKLLKESKWYGVDFRAVGETDTLTPVAKQVMQREALSGEDTLTSCPYCPYNAKTAFGLKSHLRFKHADKAGKS